MSKDYKVVTTLVFEQTITANSSQEAKDKVAETFLGLEVIGVPTNDEMVATEIKPKKKCIKKKLN